KVRRQLRNIAMVDIDREMLEQAGGLMPADLRSLDAIHVAAALSLGDDLDGVVSYDARMATAAAAQGLSVASPA
ncbi:MAG: PIN domain-containing protein, partial [Candidatus Dormibacteraeota bacterium]|nr:PIN domain-containing protein [Candidatus Dormibacteraeota bacterium]